MFTINEKIESVKKQIETLESELTNSYGYKTPNVYSHSLKLKIKILVDVLEVYENEINDNIKAPTKTVIYCQESGH